MAMRPVAANVKPTTDPTAVLNQPRAHHTVATNDSAAAGATATSTDDGGCTASVVPDAQSARVGQKLHNQHFAIRQLCRVCACTERSQQTICIATRRSTATAGYHHCC